MYTLARDAGIHEERAYGTRAALAETKVVFACSSFVAVPFYENGDGRISG